MAGGRSELSVNRDSLLNGGGRATRTGHSLERQPSQEGLDQGQRLIAMLLHSRFTIFRVPMI